MEKKIIRIIKIIIKIIKNQNCPKKIIKIFNQIPIYFYFYQIIF